MRFIVRHQIMVPHDARKRERDYLPWPGRAIADAVAHAEADKLALVLTHSHPGGLFGFSDFDDASDQLTIGSRASRLPAGDGQNLYTTRDNFRSSAPITERLLGALKNRAG